MPVERTRSTVGEAVRPVLQGKLQVPHSLAVDTCANALYVADRGAAAVRRFNIAGEFAGAINALSTIGHVGAVA